LFAYRAGKFLDFNKVPLGHAVLLATGSDYGIFHRFFRPFLFKGKPGKSQQSPYF
jgi:hypothetical protein